MAAKHVVTVYGLSTEGYAMARQMAAGGARVYIVDEATSSAISLESEIARTYPNVLSLREDEPLLTVESTQAAISKSQYLFFAPTVRKTGQDIKTEIQSKFRDAITPMKKGGSVVNHLPVGFGGSGEAISLLEYVTGFVVGESVSYYHYPISGQRRPNVIGSFDGMEDAVLAGLLADDRPQRPFVNLNSSEYLHSMDVLSRFSRTSSTIEICKLARDSATMDCLLSTDLKDLYLDDMISGLYDLRFLGASFEGVSTIMYLINGASKGIDGYIKRLVDVVKGILKRNNLKASRAKLLLLWTLDQDCMMGDKMEVRQNLASRLRDYVGDISMQKAADFDLFHSDKTTIVVSCTKPDFENVLKYRSESNLILVKANPLYETIQ